MAFSVFKLLAKNIFSFSDFIDNFKKGPKGFVKNLLIILLALYCFVVFAGLFSVNLLNIYSVLEKTGKTSIMPCFGLISGILVTFIFGFLSIAANYYTGDGENQLLCMPLKPKDIFTAKFFLSVVTESLFCALVIVICAVIYGIKEHLYTNPLFYLGIIVSLFTICVFCVFVLFSVFILILTIFPFLRRKAFLQGIATIILLGFSIGMGALGSLSSSSTFSAGEITNLQMGYMLINSWIGKLSELKGISLFANCIIGDFSSIIIMLVIGLLITFVFVPLLAPLYIKSLNGFSDVKTKKMNKVQVQKALQESYKTKSILRSLYFRDVKIVWREPAFFVNGPLFVFIMPVLLVIPFVMGIVENTGFGINELSLSIAQIFTDMSTASFGTECYYIVLALAGVVIFTGTGANIASTSFSREGKGLNNLKSMPIANDTIVFAKFLHAITYCFLANAFLFVVVFVVFLIINLLEFYLFFVKLLVLSTVLSLVVSLLIIFLEMFMDTINPKLTWENPTAAFKQNINSIIGVFGTILIIAIFAGLAILLPKNIIGYIVLLAVFGIITAPVGYFYFKYAPKKFTLM